ncbi:hypothetical protein [Azospirillum sp. TSH64]|uniref:hypothetical protein n=1 Tax=Azospirillum sp. TSH64 TaxID=652740 RepID=UPI000D61D553|nr:hypothetical protein [Azospirillum sp. TSH64]PWC81286.1 hypothetical protein TSH64_01215 [Azospirillum sp. TSH64]
MNTNAPAPSADRIPRHARDLRHALASELPEVWSGLIDSRVDAVLRREVAKVVDTETRPLRHDLANATQVRVFLEGRVAELEGRPEVPAALSPWFPFVAECLRDYARLLEDGAIDRAGRYLSHDIEKAAETLERAVEPAAPGEVCKVCEGIGELVVGLSLESCRAIELVPCHACRGKPTDPAIAAVVAEERGAA